MLTDREKGIIHYICVMIVSILDGKKKELFLKTFERLQNERARSLSDEEIDEMKKDLEEEFMLSHVFMKSEKDWKNWGMK